MASDVGIANIALRGVGATRITSFGDGTKNANVISDIYYELRRALMSAPWSFAETRIQLARSVTAPAYEFDYAYTLPSDWLWTISAHNNDEGVGSIYYKEAQVGGQKVLVTDEEAVYLRYTKDESDPNIMSAEFRYALAMALARDISIPLASSDRMYENFSTVAKRAYSRAQGSDAMGSFPERRPLGSWRNSRSGYNNGSWFRP